jgi:hypothetical protein
MKNKNQKPNQTKKQGNVTKTNKLPVLKTQKEISHKVKAHRIPMTNEAGEYIPNAHLADQQLQEVNLHPTIDEKDLVIKPIFSPIEQEEKIESLPSLNPIPEEQQVQYNFEPESYTPVQRIEAFVMSNFKEHLIERTLFIQLLEVISEAKQQEVELLNS